MRHLPLIAVTLAACSASPSPAPTPPWTPDQVAAVNGVAITGADLALRGRGGHTPPADADPIDELVREELAAQRARALGLDDDPAFQAELRRLEAPALAFRREQLAARFYDHLEREISIDDAAARAYFDAHAAEIRTELTIRQIMKRDRALLQVEELAAAPPVVVRWHQIPEAWRPTLDKLPIGATSDVIPGPRDRFWIIQIVERREVPTISFDDVEDVIVEQLRAEAVATRRAAADLELRDLAHVVRR